MTTMEQTDLKQAVTEPTDVDAAAVEEFATKLIETITGGLITGLIEIGRRTELFELAAAGPATSAGLAERGGLQERYVREWLPRWRPPASSSTTQTTDVSGCRLSTRPC